VTFTSAMTPAEIDGVLDDHYSDDARRRLYEHRWEGLRVVSTAPPLRLHGHSLAIDEVLVEAQVSGPPLGEAGRTSDLRFRVLHVFELRDGAVEREHVWVDLGEITAQLRRGA
jgi:hypothetical protein